MFILVKKISFTKESAVSKSFLTRRNRDLPDVTIQGLLIVKPDKIPFFNPDL